MEIMSRNICHSKLEEKEPTATYEFIAVTNSECPSKTKAIVHILSSKIPSPLNSKRQSITQAR